MFLYLSLDLIPPGGGGGGGGAGGSPLEPVQVLRSYLVTFPKS